MDQNTNAQGQQNWNEDEKSQGQPGDQARGTGTQGEKNSSGISNRGMSSSEEQADLPSRGSGDQSSSDQSDQSER